MAALSYYPYNYEAAFQQLNSNMSTTFDPPQTELLPELNFDFQDSYCGNFDNLFDHNDLFYFDEHCNNPAPCFQPDQNNIRTTIDPTEPFLLKQEVEPFHYPKHQKPKFGYEETMFSENQFSQHALFNDEVLVPNPFPNLPERYLLPEIAAPPPPLPAFPIGPPVYSSGSCEQSWKKQSISPQSFAARQRRRKITEKTQELGKLIPGAHKLNTAEMFRAAYKYIKFLQAQAGILQFSGSYPLNQENDVGTFQSEELHGLLESPMVQEKLYSTENCLVPQKLVKELSFDGEMLESKPQVLKEIRRLLPAEER